MKLKDPDYDFVGDEQGFGISLTNHLDKREA